MFSQIPDLTTRYAALLCLTLLPVLATAQSCPPLTLDGISDPGPFTVATLTEDDGIRNGPDYRGATIYYPTDGAGPFTGMVMVPGFTGMVMVPGFTAAPSSIAGWGPFLASHGIITMIVGTNSPFDFPPMRSDALLDGIVTLTAENTRAGSPLNGQIATDRMAVGGWSMGGGGAQLAAVADPSLKAVMALTPWLDPNGTSEDDLDHSVPVLIFSGENDPTAPPAIHADRHYDFTPDATEKLLFEIDNGDHSVSNGPTGAGGDVGQTAISWLNQYLIGDVCYCAMREDQPATASNYLTSVICPPVTVLPITLEALSLKRTKDSDRIFYALTATDLARVELHGGFDQPSANLLEGRPGAQSIDDRFEYTPTDLSRPYYYRLRFVDYDGSYSWSDWLAASPNLTRALPQVQYGDDGTQLQVREGGPKTAFIIDGNGRRVATMELAVGINQLPHLTRGIYFIGFARGGGVRYFAR